MSAEQQIKQIHKASHTVNVLKGATAYQRESLGVVITTSEKDYKGKDGTPVHEVRENFAIVNSHDKLKAGNVVAWQALADYLYTEICSPTEIIVVGATPGEIYEFKEEGQKHQKLYNKTKAGFGAVYDINVTPYLGLFEDADIRRSRELSQQGMDFVSGPNGKFGSYELKEYVRLMSLSHANSDIYVIASNTMSHVVADQMAELCKFCRAVISVEKCYPKLCEIGTKGSFPIMGGNLFNEETWALVPGLHGSHQYSLIVKINTNQVLPSPYDIRLWRDSNIKTKFGDIHMEVVRDLGVYCVYRHQFYSDSVDAVAKLCFHVPKHHSMFKAIGINVNGVDKTAILTTKLINIASKTFHVKATVNCSEAVDSAAASLLRYTGDDPDCYCDMHVLYDPDQGVDYGLISLTPYQQCLYAIKLTNFGNALDMFIWQDFHEERNYAKIAEKRDYVESKLQQCIRVVKDFSNESLGRVLNLDVEAPCILNEETAKKYKFVYDIAFLKVVLVITALYILPVASFYDLVTLPFRLYVFNARVLFVIQLFKFGSGVVRALQGSGLGYSPILNGFTLIVFLMLFRVGLAKSYNLPIIGVVNDHCNWLIYDLIMLFVLMVQKIRRLLKIKRTKHYTFLGTQRRPGSIEYPKKTDYMLPVYTCRRKTFSETTGHMRQKRRYDIHVAQPIIRLIMIGFCLLVPTIFASTPYNEQVAIEERLLRRSAHYSSRLMAEFEDFVIHENYYTNKLREYYHVWDVNEWIQTQPSEKKQNYIDLLPTFDSNWFQEQDYRRSVKEKIEKGAPMMETYDPSSDSQKHYIYHSTTRISDVDLAELHDKNGDKHDIDDYDDPYVVSSNLAPANPRCICGASDKFNLAVGPSLIGLSKAMYRVFNTAAFNVYASGITVLDLGESIRKNWEDGYVRTVSLDHSKWDSNVNEDLLLIRDKLYMRIGVPAHIIDHLVKSRANVGSGKFWSFVGCGESVGSKVRSGDQDTSSGNTLLSIYKHLFILYKMSLANDKFVYYACGDDALIMSRISDDYWPVYASLSEQLGLPTTTSYKGVYPNHPVFLSFLSSHPLPAMVNNKGVWIMSPLTTRAIYKMGYYVSEKIMYNINKPVHLADYTEWARGVLIGAEHAITHNPILNAYVQKAFKFVGRYGSFIEDDNPYKLQATNFILKPIPLGFEWLQIRYKEVPGSVESLIDEIDCVQGIPWTLKGCSLTCGDPSMVDIDLK